MRKPHYIKAFTRDVLSNNEWRHLWTTPHYALLCAWETQFTKLSFDLSLSKNFHLLRSRHLKVLQSGAPRSCVIKIWKMMIRFSHSFLLCQEQIYRSIKDEPFKIPNESYDDLMYTFFSPEKEGWLLKQGGRWDSQRNELKNEAEHLKFNYSLKNLFLNGSDNLINGRPTTHPCFS